MRRRWWWALVLAVFAAAGVIHEVWWSRTFDRQEADG